MDVHHVLRDQFRCPVCYAPRSNRSRVFSYMPLHKGVHCSNCKTSHNGRTWLCACQLQWFDCPVHSCIASTVQRRAPPPPCTERTYKRARVQISAAQMAVSTGNSVFIARSEPLTRAAAAKRPRPASTEETDTVHPVPERAFSSSESAPKRVYSLGPKLAARFPHLSGQGGPNNYCTQRQPVDSIIIAPEVEHNSSASSST